jgi:hypothetical protein
MNEVFMPSVPLQTAVLFLVFNRPVTTKQVFEVIRQAKPPKLYVAADGPRTDREGEVARVSRVRQIATAVDWPCEVKTLFRNENLGCKKAVSSGIDWFFENEEQGIILEDDCLPHPNFFAFCETLLNRYASDERVWVVTGDNFQDGKQRGDGSYYFSRYNHVWGWASWRRAWTKRDMEMRFWPNWKTSSEWTAWVPDKIERKYWAKIFDQMERDEIDTWDYQWTGSVWFGGGLTATPNVNLISNIGFGLDSTHTASPESPLANMDTHGINVLIHPTEVRQDVAADAYVFDHTFGGRYLRFPWSVLSLPRRIAGGVYRRLKRSFA